MKTVELYYLKETVAQAIVKYIVMTVAVVFCVYISGDSVFWTFITGGFFLFTVCAKLVRLTKDTKNTFNSKKDIQAWVDGLDND
jgi:hypothetical protein